jgi:hypothetical protein
LRICPVLAEDFNDERTRAIRQKMSQLGHFWDEPLDWAFTGLWRKDPQIFCKRMKPLHAGQQENGKPRFSAWI